MKIKRTLRNRIKEFEEKAYETPDLKGKRSYKSDNPLKKLAHKRGATVSLRSLLG